MMRRKTIKCCFLIGIVIAIVVLLPWGMGFWIKAVYQRNIEASQASDSIQVELKSYQQGWFHSKAIVILHVPSRFLLINNQDADKPLQITVHQSITHGPFLIQARYLLGMATIDSSLDTVRYVDSDDQLLFSLQEADVLTQAMMNPAEHQGSMKLSKLAIMLNQGLLTLPHVELTWRGQEELLNLWIGKVSGTIPEINFKTADELPFLIKGLRISFSSQHDKGILSLSEQIQIDQLGTDLSWGPIQWDVMIDGLDEKTVSAMLLAYQKYLQVGELYQNQLRNKLFLLVTNLIGPGARFNLNTFTLKNQEGRVKVEGYIQWPQNKITTPENMIDFLKEADMKWHVLISEPLMDEVIEFMSTSSFFSPYSREEKIYLRQIEQDIDVAYRLNAILLIDFIQKGILPEDIGNQLGWLQKNDIFEKEYLATIKLLFLNKKIQLVTAYQLYFQYAGLQSAVKQLEDGITEHRLEAKKALQQDLTELLQEGYIIKKANDYEIKWSSQDGVIKLNNKEIKEVGILK